MKLFTRSNLIMRMDNVEVRAEARARGCKLFKYPDHDCYRIALRSGNLEPKSERNCAFVYREGGAVLVRYVDSRNVSSDVRWFLKKLGIPYPSGGIGTGSWRNFNLESRKWSMEW